MGVDDFADTALNLELAADDARKFAPVVPAALASGAGSRRPARRRLVTRARGTYKRHPCSTFRETASIRCWRFPRQTDRCQSLLFAGARHRAAESIDGKHDGIQHSFAKRGAFEEQLLLAIFYDAAFE